MKVLFVVPKTKSMFGDEKAVPAHAHVGIAYLAATLKRNGSEVKIFDEGIEDNEAKFLNLIEEFEPGLLGVTAFSYCYRYVYDVITRLNTYAKYPIVVGGPHVSATKKEILIDTKADFAIKAEGEITLLELISEMKSPRPDFSRVDGLIWRNQENKIIENRERAFIRDLDSLPFPDYEAFEIEKYPCYLQKTLPIITSRGCPYNCNFCSVRLSMGRRFRARTPKNVVNEIEYWYKKGWNSFEINDDCFSLDIGRAMKICELIIQRGLKITYQLYNGIRPGRINKELLLKMKQSGCLLVSYGCEAGNEKTLKAIKKGITLEQVRKAVEWANEAGIKNSVNFIIGHPGETYETAIDSIRFAKSLPTNFVNFYNLVPYPGTELFEWANQNAHFLVPLDTYLNQISYRDNSPIFETKEFTKEERKKVIKNGFALYERKILQFRLGKLLGYIGFLLTRLRPLAKVGRSFAQNNRIGRKIFILLSAKSRE